MLRELLKKNKSSITDRWIQLIIETYPLGASEFLKSQKDRFSNPVGHIITDTVIKLFDEIINENNIETIKIILNDIIKLRAVQDFLPSEAADIIFSLKKVLYQELAQEFKKEKFFHEFIMFESELDKIALITFDMYIEAREKVFQIRVNEIKSRSSQNITG